ncbi:hypothetical protein AB0D49_05000 [Streptomyces sp. NPDC048290]
MSEPREERRVSDPRKDRRMSDPLKSERRMSEPPERTAEDRRTSDLRSAV